MIKDKIKENVKNATVDAVITFKWIMLAVISGVIVGGCAVIFSKGMTYVTNLRLTHPFLIYMLPFGGLVIIGIYHLSNNKHDSGTNLVLSSIHSGDTLPFKVAPLIFISTIITHLLGGSAGREGAALQLGGSMGSAMGKLIHMDEKDTHIMIMSGMSAAFAAMFGTPIAAAVFSMEVISVGIMHYSALVPCAVAGLTATGIAKLSNLSPEAFTILNMPAFSVKTAVYIGVLAILSAVVSIIFCMTIHQVGSLFKRFIKNQYIRIFAGGCIIIILTLLVGSQTYNGAGMDFIGACIENKDVPFYAFLLKIVFTAITLGSGYKGGEIVPAFFTGAAFGHLFGVITGISPSLCASVGMIGVFCGITNCPLASLLISFELFNFTGAPYFVLAVALSYAFSGYFGLYSSQKILYSKYKASFINRKTM